jgi:hypothetical protein
MVGLLLLCRGRGFSTRRGHEAEGAVGVPLVIGPFRRGYGCPLRPGARAPSPAHRNGRDRRAGRVLEALHRPHLLAPEHSPRGFQLVAHAAGASRGRSGAGRDRPCHRRAGDCAPRRCEECCRRLLVTGPWPAPGSGRAILVLLEHAIFASWGCWEVVIAPPASQPGVVQRPTEVLGRLCPSKRRLSAVLPGEGRIAGGGSSVPRCDELLIPGT